MFNFGGIVLGKRRKIITIVFVVTLLVSQIAFATYSSYGTFSIKNDPTVYTTTGSKLKSTKTTTSSKFSVYASAKTMWTTPSLRLVNSQGAVRSSYRSIPNTGVTYTGTNNTGKPGYYYYAQVKPAVTQIGTDSIKLKFNAK